MLASVFVLVGEMFDEFKEGKYFKKVTDSYNETLESYNVKYFKEIKPSHNLQKAEAHLEPKRASIIYI